MAERKTRKTRKSSARNKSGLSQKSVKRIRDEAQRTRRRIKDFSLKHDVSMYTVPSIDDYLLTNLLQRVANGETVRSIMRELRNITATSIEATYKPTFTSFTGYSFSSGEYSTLVKAVDEANQNIRTARQKFADFTDILPEEFNLNKVLDDIVGPDSITNKINDLKLFTPDNLIPTSINDTGEAGTLAEYQYYRNILERENERRRQVQAENDPRTNEGYFRQQADYDTSPIDIDKITEMPMLRKRAETWDDPARIYRANLYLNNYTKSLDMFEAVLINNGFYNSVIQERIEYIREVIANLYNNEKAITFASSRMPNIDIALLYNNGNGEVDFASIYDAWCEIDDMFN